MDRVEAFNQHRPLLFGIAYRMLGSVMDAEDVVQDTYLRWQEAARDDVRSPKAYLSTVATRLAIDRLRSARQRRESYIGPWLPEPLVLEEGPDVDDRLALADSLSMAFLVLLESLSPLERAAYLLREVFEYEYGEIARIVEKSEANCRQLVRRARQRIAERRPRFDVTREQVEELMARFFRASSEGDMEALMSLLTEDVTLWSDGGGKVAAALNPIAGPQKVARFFAGLTAKLPPAFAYRLAWVNGGPGVVNYVDGRPQSVLTLELRDGRVSAVRIVVNPEKLRRVPGLAR